MKEKNQLVSSQEKRREDTYIFHYIKCVEPSDEYTLFVTFIDGTKKRYRVSLLFEKYEMFKVLQENHGLFETVRVDVGGYGISWNDDLDISCNELWDHGVTVKS